MRTALAWAMSLFLIAAATAALAAPPDCQKANPSPTLKTICGDPTLQGELSLVQTKLKRADQLAPALADVIEKAQANFMNRLNRCGADSGCIGRALAIRAGELADFIAQQDPSEPAPANTMRTFGPDIVPAAAASPPPVPEPAAPPPPSAQAGSGNFFIVGFLAALAAIVSAAIWWMRTRKSAGR